MSHRTRQNQIQGSDLQLNFPEQNCFQSSQAAHQRRGAFLIGAPRVIWQRTCSYFQGTAYIINFWFVSFPLGTKPNSFTVTRILYFLFLLHVRTSRSRQYTLKHATFTSCPVAIFGSYMHAILPACDRCIGTMHSHNAE